VVVASKLPVESERVVEGEYVEAAVNNEVSHCESGIRKEGGLGCVWEVVNESGCSD
jgi:hypothetical protein